MVLETATHVTPHGVPPLLYMAAHRVRVEPLPNDPPRPSGDVVDAVSDVSL